MESSDHSDQPKPAGQQDGQPKEEEENLKGEAFNYDDILEHLGQLGKFQLRTVLWLCVPALFPAFVTMSLTFTGGVPDYRCFVDGCDEVESQGQDGMDYFSPPWLNNTIPGWEGESSSTDNRIKRQCYVYNHTWNNVEECLAGSDVGIDQEIQCSEWVYDDSIFGSTVVTDFELVCDDENKRPIPGMAYMAGNVFGPLLFGFLTDKTGRKPAFTLCVFILFILVTGAAFSTNIITFSVLRFLSGICNIGFFDIYYVWGVEAVGESYRVVVGFMFQLLFTAGSAVLGIIAYFVRDWRKLHLIIGVPIFTFVSLYWMVPESIRWLIAKRRYKEAKELILKASKVNKRSIPDHLLVIPYQHLSEQQEKGMAIFTIQAEEILNDEKRPSTTKDSTENSEEGVMDILRSTVMVKRIVILMAAWFASVMGYYGITFAANNLSSSFYINYELIMLVEIPAYIFGIYITDKVGRRLTLSVGLLISGVGCLITGLLPADQEVTQVVFSLIGKFFISTVMAALYAATVELFPTETRAITMGICSTSGRFGGILAPLLADAGSRIDPAFPYIVFAIANIAVGVLCFLLPETNNLPLPNNIQEAIDMEKHTFSLRGCCKIPSGEK
ncbi:organic cation transporter protein-like [Daphnia pulicaria]|uniref:organic cation transporter protein-like n=1 Tax=Daphnia pulicaria TaxID=35523 RepID=UPI001EEA02B6|nr:organic cation transporter protein-like [Daphnia pulicaria]